MLFLTPPTTNDPCFHHQSRPPVYTCITPTSLLLLSARSTALYQSTVSYESPESGHLPRARDRLKFYNKPAYYVISSVSFFIGCKSLHWRPRGPDNYPWLPTTGRRPTPADFFFTSYLDLFFAKFRPAISCRRFKTEVLLSVSKLDSVNTFEEPN